MEIIIIALSFLGKIFLAIGTLASVSYVGSIIISPLTSKKEGKEEWKVVAILATSLVLIGILGALIILIT